MIGSIGLWRLGAVTASALIAAAVLVAPDPAGNLRSAIALHDFGHVVAFGIVTALLAFSLGGRGHPGLGQRVRAAAVAAVAATFVGAAVEVAQTAIGGNGDVWDVFRDAGGALAVALMLVAGRPELSGRARAALAIAATTSGALFAVPTLAALFDEAFARSQFPVLASFEHARELSRFNFGMDANPTLTTTVDVQGKPVPAIRLRLPAGKYPGLGLRYFPGDWRGMRALRLLLVNPDPTPFEMTVRIDDIQYDYKLDLADRYNRSFVLLPGPNQIDISLVDIASGPRGRRLDLAKVDLVLVYAVDLHRPRDIVVGPIVLVP